MTYKTLGYTILKRGGEGSPVADPGEGPEGPGAPLFLDQNEARRAEKKVF